MYVLWQQVGWMLELLRVQSGRLCGDDCIEVAARRWIFQLVDSVGRCMFDSLPVGCRVAL